MTFLKHHWFGLILSLFMLAYLLVFVLVLLSPRYDVQKRGFIPCTETMAEQLIDCDNGAWCMLKTIVRNGWCDAEVIGGGFRMWLRGEQKTPWANYLFEPEQPRPDEETEADESVKIVLNAYREFSPKLYNVAKDFFDNDWIDVPPRDGKRSGAFCASATAEHHPYLLLNFAGKQNDILTLAHELGHGCHHQLRTKNGDLNEYSRMTSEEVASVFGEMITFQSLLRSLEDDRAKLCLIAGKVNDMINTAIRQIAFHFFETRCHDERKDGELSEDRLCQIWLEEMRNSLGRYVNVDENSAYIWMQVGHFFFLPFYVYAYSFADCLVNSLYQVSQEGSIKDFPDKYLDMLSKTAITDYDKLLKPFGLNPDSADFWNKGLSLISGYIDQLEALDKKLKL